MLIQQNRGIGEAICKSLASTIREPFILYATTRKGVDLGIQTSSENTEIRYPVLDIGDPASIESLAESIKSSHDGLDVLINNAGVNYEREYSPETVKKTLDINFRATLRVSQPLNSRSLCPSSGSKELLITDVPNIYTLNEEEWPHCEHILHCLLSKAFQ